MVRGKYSTPYSRYGRGGNLGGKAGKGRGSSSSSMSTILTLVLILAGGYAFAEVYMRKVWKHDLLNSETLDSIPGTGGGASSDLGSLVASKANEKAAKKTEPSMLLPDTGIFKEDDATAEERLVKLAASLEEVEERKRARRSKVKDSTRIQKESIYLKQLAGLERERLLEIIAEARIEEEDEMREMRRREQLRNDMEAERLANELAASAGSASLFASPGGL